MNNRIKFFNDFETGIFQKRPNRFLIECLYKGEVINAHLPNPGRLWEILQKGRTVYLIREIKKTSKSARLTDFTVIGALKESIPVFLHTQKTNEIARFLIENNYINELEGYKIEKPEFSINSNRFDFLLKKGNELFLLEIKSCTLFNRNFAMFPDAVTSRGKKHIYALSRSDIKCGILFIVHSNLPDYFLPEYHVDPEFASALYAHRNEIFIKAIGIGWNKDLSMERNIKTLSIPWDVYEREGKDTGSYLLILKNHENKWIKVGKLGEIFFKKGFYIYVGSAMKNLKARLERHKAKNKNLFWHIDYFREKTELIQLIPIRSSMRNECKLAKKINETADGYIKGFGVSDCECISHLFYMNQNPLENHHVIETIMFFRTPSIIST